jgi:hypothetical protein
MDCTIPYSNLSSLIWLKSIGVFSLQQYVSNSSWVHGFSQHSEITPLFPRYPLRDPRNNQSLASYPYCETAWSSGYSSLPKPRWGIWTLSSYSLFLNRPDLLFASLAGQRSARLSASRLPQKYWLWLFPEIKETEIKQNRKTREVFMFAITAFDLECLGSWNQHNIY